MCAGGEAPHDRVDACGQYLHDSFAVGRIGFREVPFARR